MRERPFSLFKELAEEIKQPSLYRGCHYAGPPGKCTVCGADIFDHKFLDYGKWLCPTSEG